MISRPYLYLLLGILTFHAYGEPMVSGFNRFHAREPSAEGGRLLFNELGCVNCHIGTTGLPTRHGPNLGSVTQRVRVDWFRNFLATPSITHEGTTMPQLLPSDDDNAVEAVRHYLGSLPAKPYRPKQSRHVNAVRGGDLFHTLGCVACHAPRRNFQRPDGKPGDVNSAHRSVGFPALREKYVLSSLAEFLLDPLKVRPDGRMPRIKMEEQDAVDIAGYLLNFQGSDGREAETLSVFAPDPALVERGRALVTSLRCAACHFDLPREPRGQKVPLRRQAGGCLSAASTANVPRYELSRAQRTALTQYLRRRDEEPSVKETATLTLQALNCAACHQRDGQGGPDPAREAYFLGDPNLGDTGRYPPPLTGVGRKLHPEWLGKVLAGSHRVRPYLRTKMPVYGSATAGLAALLAEADSKTETPLPSGDDTAGRKLIGAASGLACITCHRWGQRPALGIQALDLSNLGQRLQPGWLREYLIDPAAYRPGTLMPSFWPEGKSANQEILDGTTDRQIASILSFAKSANGEPDGYPDNTAGQFELIPKEQAIVLRTFMEGVGTHAILVGFPAGIHLAYDGKNARPALAWKGKFFDAYTTWFSRFAPFEKPLGGSVVQWPVATAEDAEFHFEGYRLDSKRVPTFLFTVDGVRVEERFDPITNGLRRTLGWNATALKSPPITHPEGVTISEEPNESPGNRSFTYLWK
jgi:cytochrome c553